MPDPLVPTPDPEPATTENKLFALLDRQGAQATTERAALAQAFSDALAGLRWELRILMVLFAALALARDGVLAKIGIPGLTLETRSASTPFVPTASAASPDPTAEPSPLDPIDLPDPPSPTP